jgi:hypothetical protein
LAQFAIASPTITPDNAVMSQRGISLRLILLLSLPVCTAVAADLSLDEATAKVRAESGGQVVRADRKEQAGKVVYEIRILKPDGMVRTYLVDASTGTVQ